MDGPGKVKNLPIQEDLCMGVDANSCLTMCLCVSLQVPEQQQNQCVGAWSLGPSGINPAGPETEPKPHQPDSCESLPAPEAHPAVSTTGLHLLYSIVAVPTRLCFNLSEYFDLQEQHSSLSLIQFFLKMSFPVNRS